ncbi:hypothetical protein PGB90_004804 [Kerria lacca]
MAKEFEFYEKSNWNFVLNSQINGMLLNTGQSLVFRVDKENRNHVNITGGPLAYRYQFEEFYIHYGSSDHSGSEHTISGYAFPAEIQLYGYNSELYHNMSEAQQKAQGTVGISVMVQISDTPNPDIRIITAPFKDVKFKGNKTPIKHLSLQSFLPDTISYMTYEGSLTYPGCWETTVWIILNKPIYMSKSELYSLRNLKRGSKDASIGPLGDNSRPTQTISNRTVRTNINFKKVSSSDDIEGKRKKDCSREFVYRTGENEQYDGQNNYSLYKIKNKIKNARTEPSRKCAFEAAWMKPMKNVCPVLRDTPAGIGSRLLNGIKRLKAGADKPDVITH